MDVPARDGHRPTPPAARRVDATIVFVGVAGFTALSHSVGPERAYLAVTGCLRLLDAIARRHGGAVDKYQGDSLMVVFGHPAPLARPARAAAEAALDMRRQVRAYDRALGLPVRLALQGGIATGALVAGDVGGRVVREFHVLGDTVNVAARLKARAGLDAIRADAATVREAGDRFGWTPLEALALEGKSRTVAAAELIGVRGPRAVRTLVPEDPPAARLIGRDAERAALSDAIGAHAVPGRLVDGEDVGDLHDLREIAGEIDAPVQIRLREPEVIAAQQRRERRGVAEHDARAAGMRADHERRRIGPLDGEVRPCTREARREGREHFTGSIDCRRHDGAERSPARRAQEPAAAAPAN
jgi:class 3 adenylate cyclase